MFAVVRIPSNPNKNLRERESWEPQGRFCVGLLELDDIFQLSRRWRLLDISEWVKLRTLTHQVCQEGGKLERVVLVHVAVEKELVRRWLFEMVRASDVLGVEGGSVWV